MNQLIKLTAYLSWLSVLIPLSIFMFRKKSLTTTLFRLIISYLMIALLSDSLIFFLAINGKPSLIVNNLFYLFQFILTSLFFFTIMRPWRLFIIGMCVVYTVCFFLVPSFDKPLTEYQLVMFRVGDVFLLLFSLRYAATVLEFNPLHAPFTYSTVWIVVTVQLYFGCNIILLSAYADTFEDAHPANGMLIWFLHNVNNIVKNGLLAKAIYCFSMEHLKWGVYRQPERER